MILLALLSGLLLALGFAGLLEYARREHRKRSRIIVDQFGQWWLVRDKAAYFLMREINEPRYPDERA